MSRLASSLSSHLRSADPGIVPNQDGLPGLAAGKHIVGTLLTWGLVACVAGPVVSVVAWAVAHERGNYAPPPRSA